MGEHVVVVAFQSKASLQSSGNDYDIMLRRFDRDDAPLAQGYVVLSEPTIDEDNTTTNSRYPSIALDASGAARSLGAIRRFGCARIMTSSMPSRRPKTIYERE